MRIWKWIKNFNSYKNFTRVGCFTFTTVHDNFYAIAGVKKCFMPRSSFYLRPVDKSTKWLLVHTTALYLTGREVCTRLAILHYYYSFGAWFNQIEQRFFKDTRYPFHEFWVTEFWFVENFLTEKVWTSWRLSPVLVQIPESNRPTNILPDSTKFDK